MSTELTPSATAGLGVEDLRPSSWRFLLRGRGLAGSVLVLLVLAIGLLAPVLAPFGPTEQIDGANLLGPSGAHWLGTDEVNRDVFSRLVYGIRVDVLIVFIAVPVGATIGVLAGVVSSMYGVADVVAQRVFDVILAIPVLILAIGVAAAIGPGVVTIIAVIVASEIPIFGRLSRTSVLTVRSLPYVESARVMGASNGWLLRKHLLPNSLEPLVVQLGVSMSLAVFIEGAMSFLGLGVVPPRPSLGSLVRDGIENVWTSPVYVVGPLIVIAALVLGFLLLSQAVAAARRD